MALKPRVQLPEGSQLGFGEETALAQRGIEGRRGVPLRKDEAVPSRPAGLFRIDPQLVKVEGGYHVGSRKGTAAVAGADTVDHVHDGPTEGPRPLLQVKDELLGVIAVPARGRGGCRRKRHLFT